MRVPSIRASRSVLALLLARATLACGGSVEVLRDAPGAGEIAVHGSADAVHDATHEFLRKRCGGAYTVLDETPTDEVRRTWRISYRCETGVPGSADAEARARTFVVRF